MVNPKSDYVNPDSYPILNPPFSVVSIECPTSSIEAIKPTLNLPKVPPKVFKEIDDGYIFEVIHASRSFLFDLNMDMEPSVFDESPKLDTIFLVGMEGHKGPKTFMLIRVLGMLLVVLA